MYDFDDVRGASKSEQIRAYSVERAIDHLGIGTPGETVINTSKMIENYIVNGDVGSYVTYAVEEALMEGRYQAKEAVERQFMNIHLDDLFAAKDWIKSVPEEGSDG